MLSATKAVNTDMQKKVLNTKEARVAPRTSQFAAQPVVSPREQAAAKTPHPCSKCGVV